MCSSASFTLSNARKACYMHAKISLADGRLSWFDNWSLRFSGKNDVIITTRSIFSQFLSRNVEFMICTTFPSVPVLSHVVKKIFACSRAFTNLE